MSTVKGGRRIPAEQLDALNSEVRESTAPVYEATADAIRSAYAIGYAAALGYEIAVEDDQVRIGDRGEPPGPALTGPEWVTTPAEQHEREQAVIAAARAWRLPAPKVLGGRPTAELERDLVKAVDRLGPWADLDYRVEST